MLAHRELGFPWRQQSCWLDSTFMALFYSPLVRHLTAPHFLKAAEGAGADAHGDGDSDNEGGEVSHDGVRAGIQRIIHAIGDTVQPQMSLVEGGDAKGDDAPGEAAKGDAAPPVPREAPAARGETEEQRERAAVQRMVDRFVRQIAAAKPSLATAAGGADRHRREVDLRHALRQLVRVDKTRARALGRAFAPVNVYGYVYYFLVELFRLFRAPCFGKHGRPHRHRSKPHKKPKRRRVEVLEVDCRAPAGAKAVLFSECLGHTYRAHRWWHVPRFFVCEILTTSHPAVIDQRLDGFAGHTWWLASMIVFNCSHFVAYLKVPPDAHAVTPADLDDPTRMAGGAAAAAWYIYDDVRSLHREPLRRVDIARYLYDPSADDAAALAEKRRKVSDNRWCYGSEGCTFHPGVDNTFVVYVRGHGAERGRC